MSRQLEESILLGLQQHDEDPGADDARFSKQARQLGDDDCFDLEEDEHEVLRPVQNVFCATGAGGGVDATCGKGGTQEIREEIAAVEKEAKHQDALSRKASEEASASGKEEWNKWFTSDETRANFDKIDKLKKQGYALREQLQQAIMKEHGVHEMNGGKETADKGLSAKEVNARVKAFESDNKDQATDAMIAQHDVGVNAKTLYSLVGEKDGKLLDDYVNNDVRPTGETAKALEALIAKCPPSVTDLRSYRGMRVSNEFLKDLEEQVAAGGASLKLTHPSSFTNSRSVANDFAKAKGHRAKLGSESVIMDVLIPKGTKVAALNHVGLGVGWEHSVSGSKKVRILKIKKGPKGTVISGVLEDA